MATFVHQACEVRRRARAARLPNQAVQSSSAPPPPAAAAADGVEGTGGSRISRTTS